jgi:outer membrane scaffolding protein for murein synthesis (MipA/OmpV family)
MRLNALNGRVDRSLVRRPGEEPPPFSCSAVCHCLRVHTLCVLQDLSTQRDVTLRMLISRATTRLLFFCRRVQSERRLVWAALLAFQFLASAVRAEETSQTSPKSDEGLVRGRLGVGPLVIPRYSGSTSYQVWPVPLASLEFGDFAYIDYWQAGLYVLATKDRSLGLAIVAAPRIDQQGVSLAYLHDVSGASKGGIIRFIGLRRIELGHGFGVEAFGEVEWLSAKVTDYYYGVTSSEATASRPFYQPTSSVDLVAGLHFNYDFGSKSTILFGYEASILGSAAADSPIVQTKFNNLFYVGYGLRF